MTQREDSYFDNIRPYRDAEVQPMVQRLIHDAQFVSVLKAVFPKLDSAEICSFLSSLNTQEEFQVRFIAPFTADAASSSLTFRRLEGIENICAERGQFFISNHRDIILDPGFFNILRAEHHIETTEIAVGDNLFVYPWIEWLVKLNKTFVVRRGDGIRQQLANSRLLSEYVRYTVEQRGKHAWMAQREGRAKDANDRTQESLLKMLLLGSDCPTQESLVNLYITPISFSYEYDPCDYLKAWEMQAKRDNPEHKKSPQDDLINMQTGIMGWKGRIIIRVQPSIADDIASLPSTLTKAEILRAVAERIDRSIHMGYEIYEVNHIALDLLHGSAAETTYYTAQQRSDFEAYLEKQIAKVGLPNPDYAFLRECILTMYANPLINQREALRCVAQ